MCIYVHTHTHTHTHTDSLANNQVRELAIVCLPWQYWTKALYGLMTLTYQSFTAALLLIYGSLFLSGIYWTLRVFWFAAARMSELELEQRTSIPSLVKLGKSGKEIREMLVLVYGDNAMKKTAVYSGWNVLLREEKVSLTKSDQDGQQQAELKKKLEKFVKFWAKIVGWLSEA